MLEDDSYGDDDERLEDDDRQQEAGIPSVEQEPNERGNDFNCALTVMTLSFSIIAFGGGLTLKFFPIFFKEVIFLLPDQVQEIYIFIPISMVLVLVLITRMATVFGSLQTV